MSELNSETSDTGISKKTYLRPLLEEYGDLRNLSKGTIAYSLEEGVYAEMNPPSA